jgi:hypothetical protein
MQQAMPVSRQGRKWVSRMRLSRHRRRATQARFCNMTSFTSDSQQGPWLPVSRRVPVKFKTNESSRVGRWFSSGCRGISSGNVRLGVDKQQQQPQRGKTDQDSLEEETKGSRFYKAGNLPGLLWAVYTTLKVTYLPAADM